MYRNITLMCMLGFVTGAVTAGKVHEAVKSGDRQQVLAAIQEDEHQYSNPIRSYNEDGLQPVHIAAKRGDNEMLKFLLVRFNAGINNRTKDGLTLLDIAQKHNQHETVQMLRTMELHDAIITGDLDTAEAIAKNHPNTTTHYINGITALHEAVLSHQAKAIDMLTRYGADINAKTKEEQETALHMTKNAEITIKLIRNGANVNARDYAQRTPLHTANRKKAKLLMQAGANINAQDMRGFTPLHEAVISSNKNLIKLYIENGANVNLQDEHGRTPLHLATHPYILAKPRGYEALDIIPLLTQAGAKVDIIDKNGNTPLSQLEESAQMAKDRGDGFYQELQNMLNTLQQNTKQKQS